MAMVIYHDRSAVSTLNTLNKNTNQLAKDLKKVSSGMKINGAEDGASEYAISKKMDVLTRALDQDIENSQTGRDLIKVAEGGIQEVVNNLRDMKAMALNAANDHNTDADRETIQKDFSSRMDTITEIAATTNYNGRLLLNGDYYSPVAGISRTSAGVSTNTLTGLFPDSPQVALAQSVGPRAWAAGLLGYQAPLSEGRSSVTFDFSNAQFNGSAAVVPTDFDQQGFTMACQYLPAPCPEFVSVRFDASMNIGQGQLLSTPWVLGTSNEHHVYVVGIADATSVDDIERAVFAGVKAATSAVTVTWPSTGSDDSVRASYDSTHDVRIDKVGDNYVLSQRIWPMWIYNGVRNETGGSTVVTNDKPGNPLIIHTGPKSSQHLRVFINSMHPIALGINGADVDPREHALQAIGQLDHALDYVLNENTRMGAYQMELEETKANLVTNHENTTASMSTIRDADMAKSMTDFMKDNVLSQSAQLMLAQANQTSSSVLSLLK